MFKLEDMKMANFSSNNVCIVAPLFVYNQFRPCLHLKNETEPDKCVYYLVEDDNIYGNFGQFSNF